MPADNGYWGQQQPQPGQQQLGQQPGQQQPGQQPQQQGGFQASAQQANGAQPQASQQAAASAIPQQQAANASTPGQGQTAAQPGPPRPASAQAQSGYQPPSAQIPYQQVAYVPVQQIPAYATGAVQAPPQKKSRRWIVAIVIIVCLFAFSAFCVKMCTDAVTMAYTSTSGSSVSNLSEDSIGIITLDGTIQYDGSVCSPEGLKELLDDAEDNDHVKAVVLRVNSGGGAATAGEEMAEYIREFGKPVVVSSASINASAAYEISSQADYIYVARSTEIGAIGTAMQLTDLSGLFEKLGIKMDVITSSDSKDSTYGYRSLTDEERKYYQQLINDINEMFIENVAAGRKMPIEEVRKLATGLIFTGEMAVDNGLADALGTREDAVEKAAELAGISSYDTVDLYLTGYDISSLASLLGESKASESDIIDALRGVQESHLK